jgi:hypothetical protein
MFPYGILFLEIFLCTDALRVIVNNDENPRIEPSARMFLPELNTQLMEFPKEGCSVWKELFLARALNFTDVSKWQDYRKTWGDCNCDVVYNIHSVEPIKGIYERSSPECDGCNIFFPMRDPYKRLVSSYLDNKQRAQDDPKHCLNMAFGSSFTSINDWLMKMDSLMNAGNNTCLSDHYQPISEQAGFAVWNGIATEHKFLFDLVDSEIVAHEELGLPIDMVRHIIQEAAHSRSHDGIELNATARLVFERLFKKDIEFYDQHLRDSSKSKELAMHSPFDFSRDILSQTYLHEKEDEAEDS